MKRRIFLAVVIAVNITSILAFIYCAVKVAIDPPHHYENLDTWEHHADKPASAPKE